MSEQWRAVVGFEGSYEVSDQGRVRSLDRVLVVAHPTCGFVQRRVKGRILRPGTTASGHQLVILEGGNGRYVHSLVLEAFVGPAPAGTECCHNDGTQANNDLSNLRWDTRANNIKDDFRVGVRKRGSVSRGTVPGNSYARRHAA